MTTPLRPRRLAALGATLATLALLSASPALLSASPAMAGPLDEVQWNPTEKDLNVGVAAPWEAVMSGSGRGVAFAGRYYRDYNVATGAWGPKKILHVEPYHMVADGNAAGTVCTAWHADFGAAFACRAAGSTAWVKKNLSMNQGATPHSISVSRDGRRALIAWSDSIGGVLRPRATIYTLNGQALSTTNLNNLPNPASRYMTAATRLDGRDGFTLMYVTAGPWSLGDQTFYRTYRPGSGWSGQTPIQFLSGGVLSDVYASDLASDGRRAYFAATADIGAVQTNTASVYQVAGVNSQGAITQPIDPAIAMLRPQIAVKGSALSMVGYDSAGTMPMALIEKGDFPLVTTTTRSSPTVGETVGTLTGLDVVGQSFAGGLEGATIAAEYSGRVNVGTPEERVVSRIFTLDVYYNGGVASLGALTPLGTREGDGGMQPRLSGHGTYAMLVYAAGTGRYAAVRRPVVL